MYFSALVALSLMNLFRCSVLLVAVLLGACDARETPVPKPKTEAAAQAPAATPASPVRSTADTPSESVVSPGPDKKAEPVHEMAPSVPVVPVVAGKQPVDKDSAVGSGSTPAPKVSSKAAVKDKPARREAVADARKAKKAARQTPVKDIHLAPPKLDLSLPPELVQQLDPPAKVIPARRKPILPPMFDSDGSGSGPEPFELNGRLLSNEMQLQMRNDSRRDVEGAALDFKFKQ